MKIIDCVQGTPEWRQARAGIVTASCLEKIISPIRLKPSAQQDDYLARLVSEWFLGEPLDDASGAYQQRGTELEAEARSWYSFDTNNDVQQVGFCITDDGNVGCSPDGLIGEDGGLELKCPGIETHVRYIGDETRLVNEYRCQVQGCLYVTNRKWWDLCSFSPVLPSVRVRVTRDEAFLTALTDELTRFIEKLNAAKAKLSAERERRFAVLANNTGDTPF
jgi:hypothetical protein